MAFAIRVHAGRNCAKHIQQVYCMNDVIMAVRVREVHDNYTIELLRYDDGTSTFLVIKMASKHVYYVP